MNKNKIILIVIVVIAILNVFVFGLLKILGKEDNTDTNKGESLIKIIPTDDYIDAYYKDVKVTNIKDEVQEYNLAISLNDISDELLSDKFEIILLKKDSFVNEYYEVQRTSLKYASLSKLANTIYFFVSLNSNEDAEYRLYFWQDKSIISNKNLYIDFDINLMEINNNSTEKPNESICTELNYEPVLTNGLIPVTIDNYGSVKTIENNEEWYSYCDKQWANAVLVRENVRNYYLNSKGIKINPNDILGYFVWIPRYSYKIWTTEFDEDKYSKEQEIEIKFIDKSKKEKGDSKGEWYTHPAFTFGSSELSGIWVSKFEMTGNIEYPTILPNNAPIINYNLNSYLEASLLFAGGKNENNEIKFYGSNYYGLSENDDSHLIKNSEWGAVAYLSHSRYGINDKIAINNYLNKTHLTGCGKLSENEGSSNECAIQYGNSNEYPQSTTGNISGIFDLTGGTGEYVMAYLDGNNNLSGIDKEWFSNKNNYKYYDFYSKSVFNKDFVDNIAQCTIETCAGQALYETFNWYMTIHNFVSDEFNFIKRGCGNFSDSAATQFCIGYGTGEEGTGTSSRVTIISGNDI